MDSIKYQQIKNQNLTASVRNLIMDRVWIFHQDNNPKQTWVAEHKTKLLLWPFQSSDLNPVEDEWVNWRGEAVNLKIWRDAVWRKQSLISYQVFSKLFRHYRRQLRAVTLGKGHCNNWVPIIVANMNKRKHLFHNEISPYFQLFYFNDRMEMFEWKINNADVFSQPPLRCQY